MLLVCYAQLGMVHNDSIFRESVGPTNTNANYHEQYKFWIKNYNVVEPSKEKIFKYGKTGEDKILH